MNEIKVAENKTLKLTNVVAGRIDHEEMGNMMVALTQLQNFIKSHNAQPIGPLVQALKIGPAPEHAPELYLMQQATQLITQTEPGYEVDAVLRVKNCLYAHYTGPMAYSQLASSKLQILAFEKDLKLTGDKSQYNKTYYTTHYSADDNTNTKVQDFIKSYKSKNNAEPNTFAALGYDTIYMIKQAIEKAGENATREDVRNAVAGMTFDGVTGKFTMDKSGSPTKSVTVLEMKDGKPVYNTTVQPK